MNLNFFLRGLVLGFSIAAPVGPIGVLCIRRTLADGRAVGLASGLGAATADALYGAIAGLGLTALSGLLLAQRDWLSLVGGLFLGYLGWRSWRTLPPPLDSAAPPAGGGPGSCLCHHFSTHPDQPGNHPGFCGYLRRGGFGRCPGRGFPGRAAHSGRFLWFGLMVANPHHRR